MSRPPMEILEQTKTQLSLLHKIIPGSQKNFLIGSGFIALWVGIFAPIILFQPLQSLSQATNLTCTRVETKKINCYLERFIAGIKWRQISVESLDSAQINSSTSIFNEEERINSEVILASDNKKITFVAYINSEKGAIATAREINTFINSLKPKQLTLQIERGVEFSFLHIGAIAFFSALILLILMFPLEEIWDLDRQTNLLSIRRKFLYRQQIVKYSLTEIAGAKVEIKTDTEGRQLYQSIIAFKSGRLLVLDSRSSKQQIQEITDIVNKYL